MKIIITVLLSFGLLFSAHADTDRNVKFDIDSSAIKWTGRKVTGSHNGGLKLKSAEGQFKSDGSVAGIFVIDMASLTVADIESPKKNKDLREHLASADFFNVTDHPLVTFKINKSSPIAESDAAGNNFQISGELSIKGIVKTVSFPARIDIKDGKVSAKGTATVDRTQFDVRYNSGKFFSGLGDKLIYDDFTVEVELYGSLS